MKSTGLPINKRFIIILKKLFQRGRCMLIHRPGGYKTITKRRCTTLKIRIPINDSE